MTLGNMRELGVRFDPQKLGAGIYSCSVRIAQTTATAKEPVKPAIASAQRVSALPGDSPKIQLAEK